MHKLGLTASAGHALQNGFIGLLDAEELVWMHILILVWMVLQCKLSVCTLHLLFGWRCRVGPTCESCRPYAATSSNEAIALPVSSSENPPPSRQPSQSFCGTLSQFVLLPFWERLTVIPPQSCQAWSITKKCRLRWSCLPWLLIEGVAAGLGEEACFFLHLPKGHQRGLPLSLFPFWLCLCHRYTVDPRPQRVRMPGWSLPPESAFFAWVPTLWAQRWPQYLIRCGEVDVGMGKSCARAFRLITESLLQRASECEARNFCLRILFFIRGDHILVAVGVGAAATGTHGPQKKSNREIGCRDKSGSNRSFAKCFLPRH